MTTNKELLDLRTANTPRGAGTQTNIFADRARNAEIWDVEGNTIQKPSGDVAHQVG